MRYARGHARFSTAFSLIEILVCLAVVTILAVMVLTASDRTRKSALQAGDAGNLRQIAVALEQFSQENRNRLIMGLDRDNFFGNAKTLAWMELLRPYLTSDSKIPLQCKLLVSPGDRSRGGVQKLGPNRTHRSYGINSRTEWGQVPLSKFEIRTPSKFVVMGNYDIGTKGDSANISGGLDGGSNSLNYVPKNWFGNGTANFLFLDGHVEAIKVDDIMPGAERYYLFDRSLNRPENRNKPNSAF